jgi:copper oxidase (laccase) domain-containing protein
MAATSLAERRVGSATMHTYYSTISDGNMAFRFAGETQGAKASVVTHRDGFLVRQGVDPLKLTIMEAVNGSNIEVLKPENIGGGVYAASSMIRDTDGVVIKEANVPGYRELSLGIVLADCMPISGISSRDGFMAHVGKKGIDVRVLPKTLSMARKLGIDTEEAAVAIGPCVKPCCYRKRAIFTDDPALWIDHLSVPSDKDSELRVTKTYFPQNYSQYVVTSRYLSPIAVDIVSAAIKDLNDNGVDPSKVSVDPMCTACEGKKGSMYSHTVAKNKGVKEGRALAVAQWISE